MSSFPLFADLFNEGPYAFQMRFQRGTVTRFFAPTEDQHAVLQERRMWLERTPDLCVEVRPGAEDLLQEFTRAIDLPFETGSQATGSPDKLCLQLGKQLEPDFLLLRPDEEGAMRLICGCVCFPSNWDLREKMELPIEEIHGVVPGLNSAIGKQIQTFLARLRPGISWERTNWGLSRSGQRNQHPTRRLPRLEADVPIEEIWLRVEHQSLSALPCSGGVLFGIRIQSYPLMQIKTNEALREGLVRSLKTMPEEMAVYKNLANSRGRILELLEN